MICGLDELRSKEVIDIRTGDRLGFIDDVEMNITEASVETLVIYGGARFFGIFGREEDVFISCSEIKVIGSEVILVERRNDIKREYSTKNGRKSLRSLLN